MNDKRWQIIKEIGIELLKKKEVAGIRIDQDFDSHIYDLTVIFVPRFPEVKYYIRRFTDIEIDSAIALKEFVIQDFERRLKENGQQN